MTQKALHIFDLNNYCQRVIFSFLNLKDLLKLYLFFKEFRTIIRKSYSSIFNSLIVDSNLIITKCDLNNLFKFNRFEPIKIDEARKKIESHFDSKQIFNFLLESCSNTKNTLNDIYSSRNIILTNYFMITFDNHTFNSYNTLYFHTCDYVRLINLTFYSTNKLDIENCYDIIIKNVVINVPVILNFVNCLNIFVENFYTDKQSLQIIYNQKSIDKTTIVLNNVYINSTNVNTIFGYKEIKINNCLFIGELQIDVDAILIVDNKTVNIDDFNNSIYENSQLFSPENIRNLLISILISKLKYNNNKFIRFNN